MHILSDCVEKLSEIWEFPNLVVSNLVVCNFHAETADRGWGFKRGREGYKFRLIRSNWQVVFFGGRLACIQLEFVCLKLRFFAYSRFRCLLDALSHCGTVSKKTAIVSRKAPIVTKHSPAVSKKSSKHNSKQTSSIANRKLRIVSKKAAPVFFFPASSRFCQ